MFDKVWQNIVDNGNSNVRFFTKTGLPFTYQAYVQSGEDGYVLVNREGKSVERYLFKNNFRILYETPDYRNLPLSSFPRVHGSSYVFAILTDPRILNI